jgi:hypothetical protein
MRRAGEMVVPMRVWHAARVPVDVDVPREHGSVTVQRRIEGIICRFRFVVVVSVVMLGELCLIAVPVAAVFYGDLNIEPKRLGYTFDGFPVIALVHEPEDLTRSIGSQSLGLN